MTLVQTKYYQQKYHKTTMDLSSVLNMDSIMNAATDVANTMISGTMDLVDKLMSSVIPH